MFPIEKYKYYTMKNAKGNNKIVAVTTYAGKTVRGVAVCDSKDTFDFEKGKELAATRCAYKVAMKRYGRAAKKLKEACDALSDAYTHMDKMGKYYIDSKLAVAEVENKLDDILEEM